MMPSKILFFIVVLLAVGLLNVHAKDRALLVGIGKYQNQIESLPGVRIDIENMKQSAQLMGYDDAQIKVMMNEEATLAKLKATLKNWLVDGTGAQDRVLIYFSGHGSRIPDYNGDEKDGADEVLVMYDSKIVYKNKKKTIENALLDDELNRYLNQIKSQDVMLLVDACNSGTVYRGFVGQDQSAKAIPKFLSYSGIPKKGILKKSKQIQTSNAFDVESLSSKPYRFVALTAAGDDELALTTKNGSLFTSGIKYYLQQAARNNQPITPKQLSEKVAQYIKEKVQQGKLGAVYRPQIAGNLQLLNKTIPVRPILLGQNWSALETLSPSEQPLFISTNKGNPHIGDIIEIQINIPQSGYLNVINIDPSDGVYIVYPESSRANNQVKTGHLVLPTPEMGYQLQLTEPSGENLFIAILTKEPINAYHGVGKGNKLDGKLIAELFKNKTAKDYLMGKVVLEVKSR